jgi:acyl carrier protein
MPEVQNELRQFVIDNFLFGDKSAALNDNDSLLERGIIDSTGVLELVHFLEDKYGIQVEDDELMPANLDSINNLAQFVARKTAKSN